MAARGRGGRERADQIKASKVAPFRRVGRVGEEERIGEAGRKKKEIRDYAPTQTRDVAIHRALVILHPLLNLLSEPRARARFILYLFALFPGAYARRLSIKIDKGDGKSKRARDDAGELRARKLKRDDHARCAVSVTFRFQPNGIIDDEE